MKFGLQTTLFKKISRRYAQAFFDMATEKNSIESIQLDCMLLTEMLNKSPEFFDFTQSPHLPLLPFEKILRELLETRIESQTLDFLFLLCRKNRFNLLANIIEAFEVLYHHYHTISKVEIISAIPLSAQQIDEICKKLKYRWKRAVFAVTNIDPDLIGGFQIKAGDKVLDFSLKSQLSKYRLAVLNA